MEYKGLSSFNKAELKLYDLIGVGMFRKAVFLLEKVRSGNDKLLCFFPLIFILDSFTILLPFASYFLMINM